MGRIIQVEAKSINRQKKKKVIRNFKISKASFYKAMEPKTLTVNIIKGKTS